MHAAWQHACTVVAHLVLPYIGLVACCHQPVPGAVIHHAGGGAVRRASPFILHAAWSEAEVTNKHLAFNIVVTMVALQHDLHEFVATSKLAAAAQAAPVGSRPGMHAQNNLGAVPKL